MEGGPGVSHKVPPCFSVCGDLGSLSWAPHVAVLVVSETQCFWAPGNPTWVWNSRGSASDSATLERPLHPDWGKSKSYSSAAVKPSKPGPPSPSGLAVSRGLLVDGLHDWVPFRSCRNRRNGGVHSKKHFLIPPRDASKGPERREFMALRPLNVLVSPFDYWSGRDCLKNL